jgi:hypothetical protein
MPRRSVLSSLFAKSRGWFLLPGLVLLMALAPAQMRAQGFSPYQFQNVNIGGGGGFIPGIVFSTTQPSPPAVEYDKYRTVVREELWVVEEMVSAAGKGSKVSSVQN